MNISFEPAQITGSSGGANFVGIGKAFILAKWTRDILLWGRRIGPQGCSGFGCGFAYYKYIYNLEYIFKDWCLL